MADGDSSSAHHDGPDSSSAHPEAPVGGHRTYSPPFKHFTWRSREDAMNDNDSDESYDTDEERKKFEWEVLKQEHPECYTPIPRGVPDTCFACKAPVVVRTEMGRMILECETKKEDFTRHYRRWWEEAIVEELKDSKKKIRELETRLSVVEKVSIL